MKTYEDIVTLSSTNQAKCTLCNVRVPNHDSCIITHINGARHCGRYSTRLMMRRNNIRYDCIDDDEVYCKICDVFIDNNMETVQYHLDTSEKHEELNNLIEGQYLDLPENSTDNPTLVCCTICHCYIGFTYSTIETHIGGKKHLLARAIALKPLNGLFPVTDNDDSLWCKVCDEYIDNCVDDILEHVDEDENHEYNYDQITFDDICIEDYLTNIHQDKAFCEECDVWVPCKEKNLREHVEGYRHTS